MTNPRIIPLLCASWTVLWVALAAAGLPVRGAERASDQPSPFVEWGLPERAPGPDWQAVVAFPHLRFTNVVGLTPVPGSSNLLCVWEREGRIWTFTNSAGTLAPRLCVDLSRQCQGWDDSGLLGLAFHPGFATNRFVYVYYPWVPPGTVLGSPTNRPPSNRVVWNRLSRLTLDGDQVAIPGSELVLMDQRTRGIWHLGGGLIVHPGNGFLYLAVGDNNDARNQQRIDRDLFSGILRLDPDQRGGGVSHPIRRQPANGRTANYYIPSDNPFVGRPGVLEEFFAVGLRSPYRIACDPVTGRIQVADVGNQLREEINVIEPGDPPGLNFQWPRIEGLQGDLRPPFPGVSKRPVLDYSHVEGQAIIGGLVYRGRAYERQLGGKYIFGDNVQRKIWVLEEAQGTVTKRWLGTIPKGDGPAPGPDYTGLSGFGTDQQGELYVCQASSVGGQIYSLSPVTNSGPPFPPVLSLITPLATMTSDPVRLLSYEVNSPLWSDGAAKQRWMALPQGAKIGFSPAGAWSFPAGTIFVKNFELSVDENHPAIRRRLETRLLVRDTNGAAYGITYKWRPDMSDADLLTNGVSERFSIALAPVGSFELTGVGLSLRSGRGRILTNLVELEGTGGRIGAGADQFQFAWQMRRGDFDVQARIEAPDLRRGRVGFMARASLDPQSPRLFAGLGRSSDPIRAPGLRYEMEVRAVAGGKGVLTGQPILPETPPPQEYWLRLKRHGDFFFAFSSSDSVQWDLVAFQRLKLPDAVYFGPALAGDRTGRIGVKFQFPSARFQEWYFPGTEDCLSCHTPAAGFVLGVNTRQLNRSRPDGAAAGNQLQDWNHRGLFVEPLREADLPGLACLVAVTNQSASIPQRARSYLDANCAQCHRPGGAATKWDARIETPLPEQGIILGDVFYDGNIPASKVAVPQDLSRSVLYRRLSSVGQNKMPPLSKNCLDPDAIAVLAEWIMEMDFSSASGKRPGPAK